MNIDERLTRDAACDESDPPRLPSFDAALEVAVAARRRDRRWPAMAGAAALVAAVVIGAVLLSGRTGQSSTTPAGAVPAVVHSVPELSGFTWTDEASGDTVVYTAGYARLSDDCSSARYRLDVQGRTLTVGTATVGTVSVCSPPLPPRRGQPGYQVFRRQAEASATFDRVVHGPSTWRSVGGTLVLRDAAGQSVRLESVSARKGSSGSGTNLCGSTGAYSSALSFSLSIAAGTRGQATPVKAADYFSVHGDASGIVPETRWSTTRDSLGYVMASTHEWLHVSRQPDQSWIVDGGGSCG